MTAGVAICGAGGHSRVVISAIKSRNIPILGIYDDSFREPERILGVPVLGKFQDLLEARGRVSEVYLAFGDNAMRAKWYAILHDHGFLLPALIHPSAVIEVDATVADGAMVCVRAVVGAEAVIGKGTVVNTGCSVDHESKIGTFVHLAPQVAVAGRTMVGSYSFVGMNASLADNLVIGENVVIGAGSVVLKNVPDGTRVLGLFH